MTLKELETKAEENKKAELKKAETELKNYIVKLITDAEETYKDNTDVFSSIADVIYTHIAEDLYYCNKVSDIHDFDIVKKIKAVLQVKQKSMQDFAY